MISLLSSSTSSSTTTTSSLLSPYLTPTLSKNPKSSFNIPPPSPILLKLCYLKFQLKSSKTIIAHDLSTPSKPNSISLLQVVEEEELVLEPLEASLNGSAENHYHSEEGELEVEEEEEEGCPWEGAVVYKRDSSTTHLEYNTTLERLGMGTFSTETSRSKAWEMGMRAANKKKKKKKKNNRGVTEFRSEEGKSAAEGTPVLVSMDVSRRRKKQSIRLDGIVRTVLTLPCNRCGVHAAESVFSNFSLLLSEDPVEEPEELSTRVMYERDKSKTYYAEEDEEEEFDIEDQLHFPPDDKEIDISKHIRDTIHIEITVTALCNAACKGICFKCGADLNKTICNCSQKVEVKQHGTFSNLIKKQIMNSVEM